MSDKPNGDENNGEDEWQQLRGLLDMRVGDFPGVRGVLEHSRGTEEREREGRESRGSRQQSNPHPLVEILGAILRPQSASSPDDTVITSSQKKVYETMENISRATRRPTDGGSVPTGFPASSGTPKYDRDEPVDPTTVTHGTIVTIKGSNLHTIKRITVGGAKAPIVRRASDELRFMVPEDAEDGCVVINGDLEPDLALELSDRDGGEENEREAD